MKHRWQVVGVGAAALILGTSLVARAADHTVTVPAPPSSAEGAAVKVDDVVTIGETAASSGSDEGTARANALGLGGENPLSEGVTGGTQTGTGEDSGALVQLNEGPGEHGDVDVKVTPYDVAVGPDRSAQARAALARVFVGDLVSAHVLQSQSRTAYTDDASHGTASSDAVVVCLLGCQDDEDGLEITVLHSETEDGGTGRSYVLRIGDHEILANDQDLIGADDVCSLNLDPEGLVGLRLLCVSSAAGEGTPAERSGAAAAAEADVFGDLITAELLGTAAAGADGLETPAAPAAEEPPAVEGAMALPAEDEVARASADLPRTGGGVLPPLFAGLAALALGAGTRGARRFIAPRPGR